MVGSVSNETAWELAARLRAWIEHNAESAGEVCQLLASAAAALERSAGHEGTEDEMRNGRQLSYKEVLATRGERHRPDGTPIWPLRPDDFPSSFMESRPSPRVAHIERTPAARRDDLPDWML